MQSFRQVTLLSTCWIGADPSSPGPRSWSEAAHLQAPTCSRMLQVEQELYLERTLAEQQELKAKRAIQQQQKELADIEQRRQHEVGQT